MNPENRSFHKRLVDFSVLVTALTALLFLIGWLYQIEYYEWFGVDFYSLDLPVYASLVGSIVPVIYVFSKLVSVMLPIVIFGMLVSLTTILWRFFWLRSLIGKALLTARRILLAKLGRASGQQTRQKTMSFGDPNITLRSSGSRLGTFPDFVWFLRLYMWFFVVLILFFCIQAATALGPRAAQNFYRNPKTKTTLIFKSENRDVMDKQFLKLNSEGRLRLLVQTKDLIVVFAKSDSQIKSRGAFIIPVSAVLTIHNNPLASNISRKTENPQ